MTNANALNLNYTLPSADGTSNQIYSTDGSGSVSWATPSAGGGALVLIGTVSTSGTQTSTPISIDSTYNNYIVKARNISTGGGTGNLMYVQLSTDGGSTYLHSSIQSGVHYSVYTSTTVSVQSSTSALLGAYISNSGAYTSFQSNLFLQPGQYPMMLGMAVSYDTMQFTQGVYDGSGVTINAIRLRINNSDTFSGVFSVYGVAY